MNEKQGYPLRRVVISGLGIVAPNGIGKEAFWQANIGGISGIKKITRFDASHLAVRIAGEITNFNPQEYGVSKEEESNFNRGTQLALAAASLAFEDAHLSPILIQEERERMGVYMGSAMAYVEEGEKLWLQTTNQGKQTPSLAEGQDLISSKLMTQTAASSIAHHYRLHGPSMVLATGCSAGADAIGEAFWEIQEGRVERMLAGGCDAAITPIGLDVFCVMGALSTHYNEQPDQASRPYDGERDGFVMAEGAAVLLLEEREIALARGAPIYAEILTFNSNCNAYHMAALPADGMPLQQLIQQALLESAVSAEQIQYINAHGSSTLRNEIAETSAYKAIFGPYAYSIPISATKSMIGHSQGAASAIEAAVTAMVLERQIIPPTINQEHTDPQCDLDYVPNIARVAEVKVALTHSSGFGGINSVLILAQPDWKRE